MGGNLGDVKASFQKALSSLRSMGVWGSPLLCSGLYRSAYWSPSPAKTAAEEDPQPPYLNQVVGFIPLFSPIDTLHAFLKVEAQLGRVRLKRFGARTIDLDLLCYPGSVCESEELILPHPRLHLRRFVLTPWAEIAPGCEVPGLGQTVAQLLAQCPDEGEVVRVSDAPVI